MSRNCTLYSGISRRTFTRFFQAALLVLLLVLIMSVFASAKP